MQLYCLEQVRAFFLLVRKYFDVRAILGAFGDA